MNSSSVASEIDAIIRAMEVKLGLPTVAPLTPEVSSVLSESPYYVRADITVPPYTGVTDVSAVSESIPENSKTAFVDETTSRFSDAIWYENIKSKVITLAGIGGIGSYVGLLLARMHPLHIHLYDDDIVEPGNMSGQLYDAQHVGQTKVDALADIISSFTSYYDISTHYERFTPSRRGTNIMICGFDNMEARHVFFNAWYDHVMSESPENRGKCLFIDGRLAAESFQILCLKGDDDRAIHRYMDEFLFSDAEAEPTICSYKQTSFMANMIASVMVNLFVNFCANECNPLIPRDVPFFTEYTGETMFFKVVS